MRLFKQIIDLDSRAYSVIDSKFETTVQKLEQYFEVHSQVFLVVTLLLATLVTREFVIPVVQCSFLTIFEIVFLFLGGVCLRISYSMSLKKGVVLCAS